jgi:hypothetical protein
MHIIGWIALIEGILIISPHQRVMGEEQPGKGLGVRLGRKSGLPSHLQDKPERGQVR